MLCLSSLAGVPVCKRPSLNPAALRDAERPVEGASPIRPAGIRRIPTVELITEVYRVKDNPTYQCEFRRLEKSQCR